MHEELVLARLDDACRRRHRFVGDALDGDLDLGAGCHVGRELGSDIRVGEPCRERLVAGEDVGRQDDRARGDLIGLRVGDAVLRDFVDRARERERRGQLDFFGVPLSPGLPACVPSTCSSIGCQSAAYLSSKRLSVKSPRRPVDVMIHCEPERRG